MVQHSSDGPGAEHEGESDSGSLARTVQLISGDFLLTVNPVDGSEIEPCPPGRRPTAPRKRSPEERSASDRHAAAGVTYPPVPLTPAAGAGGPLLERDEEQERLARLLGRGRSVRLTGPRGSGRSALLDAVAGDLAGLAPDGVVRLTGYRRHSSDILHDLFAAVYDAPGQRPDDHRLREALASVGALVVLDDLEFGGTALDELLAATPECAFLIATTPDVPAPSSQSHLEEVFLSGLSRTGSLDLLERAAGRPLTDEEADWGGDLWFVSEGKPLSFLQAGALLRSRGADAPSVAGAAASRLPSGADVIAGLFAGLTEPARDALRFALALAGELPQLTQLPALLGESRADGVLTELTGSALLTAAAGHYRLAEGVAEQLAAAGYDDDTGTRAENAARHYGWWAAHPAVGPERAAAEADTLVAALQGALRGGSAAAAVLLARAAAPVLAAALAWGAWERVLRSGQAAARETGEVAEEAYFHHELGVLALCGGNADRARAELEASIALRGALADRRGTVAGRRALALVTDRLAASAAPTAPGAPEAPTVAGEPGAASVLPSGEDGAGRYGPPAGPAAPYDDGRTGDATPPQPVAPYAALEQRPDEGLPALPRRESVKPTAEQQPASEAAAAALNRAAEMDESIATIRARSVGHDAYGPHSRRRLAARGTRKNMLAAGAGAALAAVVGTVLTLGAASDDSDGPSDTVRPGGSPSQPDGYTDTPSDDPFGDDRSASPTASQNSEAPRPTSEAPTPDDPPTSSFPSEDESSSDSGTASGGTSTGGSTGGGSSNGGTGNGGTTDGGTTDGGSTDGGSDGGTTDGGTTDGGTTDGGSDGGTTDGGSDGGTTDGGSDGSPTDGGTTGSPTDGGTILGTGSSPSGTESGSASR